METPPRQFRFFALPEGKVFGLGLVISVAFVLFLLAYQYSVPENTGMISAAVLMNFAAGRAAAMYLGVSLGLNLAPVITVNMFVDSMWVFIVSPLVILSTKRLLTVTFLESRIARMSGVADQFKEKIRKYGPVGLYVFVACPLPMTGPVTGCLIGYFLGFALWQTIVIALLGCFTTILMWSLVLPSVQQKAAEQGTAMTVAVLAVIVLIGLAGEIIYKRRSR